MKAFQIGVGLAASLGIGQVASANLVANGDFEAGNTGFHSVFAYAADEPGNNTELANPATYSIAVDPAGVHPDGASYGDHTTGSGLMMVVHGRDSGGTPSLLWQQVIGVQPNTLYDFSLYTTTWTSGGASSLRLAVNGQVLDDAPFDTHLADDRTSWLKYSTQWHSGDAETATLDIINISALANRGFAIDDISFTVVPEPSAALLMAGLPLMLARRRTRA